MESDDSSSRGPKPCNHYKNVVRAFNAPYTFAIILGSNWWDWTFKSLDYGWNGAVFGPWSKPYIGITPGAYDLAIGSDPSYLGQGQFGDIVQRALTSMLPGIEPSLSLVNSLYELKDIKSLPHTLSRISGALSSLEKTLQSALKGTFTAFRNCGKQTLKQIIHSGADSYLQEEFNVAPLLSDIAGFRRALSRAHQAADKLLADEGKWKRSHYNATLPSNISNTDETAPDLPIAYLDGVCRARRVVQYDPAKFSATLLYRYAIPEAMKSMITLRALLDGWGVNANPQIIWNAIPWSFVVDWFIDIGQWLRQFRVRNIEPVCQIAWMQYSVKSARHFYSYNTVGYGGVKTPGVERLLAIRDEEVYQRSTPFPPDLLSSIRLSGLDPKKFSLLTALAATRKR